ncbi:MAG: polysaccharide deacetylase family protein [Myxococcales bacterium]|nr:polysaccharide deacetylase family protein [Myxococcales bacterium]
MGGLASVTVDLDSLGCYCRIHGLPEGLAGREGRLVVYRRAVERLTELFSRRGVRPTYFAVGEDLEDVEARPALVEARAAGAEVASHSYAHDYALSRGSEQAIAADLARAEEAIGSAMGEGPVGFRAPGYALSAALMRAVVARGYRYDSSVFPAAPYYLAKASVMGVMRALGRRSGAILDRPGVLWAPREPYRPDLEDPYRRGSAPLIELPITVSRVARLPLLGTLVVMAPRAVVRAMVVGLRRERFLNLELHGIDVLDADDGIPAELLARQRELSILRAAKVERLGELIDWLKEDFELVTLAEASARLGS